MLKRFAIASALFGMVAMGCSHTHHEKVTKETKVETSSAAPAPAPVIAPDTTGKVIVHIVSRNQTITVKSGQHGVVYSVRDAAGKLMLADATPQEFEQYDPQLFNQIKHYIAVQADPSAAIEASGDVRGVPVGVPTADSASR